MSARVPHAAAGAPRAGPGAAPARAPRAGFTLIEVLVVLLIMSGLLVTISQVLHSARISRDTIHNIAETELVGPAILDQIERDLHAISTYDRDKLLWLRVQDRTLVGFDADRIDFVCNTNSLVIEASTRQTRFLRADQNEVSYCLRRRPDSDDFLELYRREDFGVDDAIYEGGHYTFLCDRVRGFDVKVWAADGPDEDPLDAWGEGAEDNDHAGLPKRLEISLTIELAPRISREQLRIAPTDKRLITYKRIVRLAEPLFLAAEVEPVPAIPDVKPAVPNADAPGGAGGPGGPGGPSGGGGGGSLGGGAGGGGNPFGGGAK